MTVSNDEIVELILEVPWPLWFQKSKKQLAEERITQMDAGGEIEPVESEEARRARAEQLVEQMRGNGDIDPSEGFVSSPFWFICPSMCCTARGGIVITIDCVFHGGCAAICTKIVVTYCLCAKPQTTSTPH